MVGKGKRARIRVSQSGTEETWRTLGIIGASHGCGVTHLGIWAANWLTGTRREKTAILEWNSHGDFARMASACRAKKSRNGAWQILEADYYAGAGADELASCIHNDYKRILIDYGVYTKEGILDWIRCDRKIMVVALSEWQMAYFRELKEQVDDRDAQWVYAAAFGSEEMRCSIRRELRISIQRIPFSEDAFIVKRKDMDFFQTLLLHQHEG